jgi:AcrR family transcriptional regulator
MGIKERKEREKERRKQQITVAAKKVFSDKGFNHATMDDIANEAELSPGTLYLYFKNKEELYASLSVRILQYLQIRVDQIVNEEKMLPEQKLDTLVEAMFDVYEFDPLVLINMFHLQSSETLKNLSPDVLNDITDLSRKAIGGISKIFKEGTKKGVFVEHHPVALSDTFWAFFSGIILWSTSKKIINKDKDYIKNTLQIGFDIFRKGLKTK